MAKGLQPSTEEIRRFIGEWNNKSPQELADGFGWSYQYVCKVASEIRAIDNNLCPKKEKPKREDVLKEAIQMYHQGEKSSL